MFKLGRAYAIRISPDTRHVATTGRNVVLWDIETRKRAAFAHPFAHPYGIDFSPDGKFLAVKSTAGGIAILEVPSLEPAKLFDRDEYGAGESLIFSADGEYLVDGPSVRAVASGAVVFQDRGVKRGIFHNLTTTSDRTTFAHSIACGEEEEEVFVRRWPFDDRAMNYSVPETVYSLALTPDARNLAIASTFKLETRAIGSWQQLDARPLPVTGSGYNMAFAPGGDMLAIAEDARVLLLRPDLSELAAWPLPYASDVHFSPAGRLLALGSWERGTVVELDLTY